MRKAALILAVALLGCGTDPVAHREQGLTTDEYYVECDRDRVSGSPVATNGDDTNNCTSAATPCKTIAAIDQKVCGHSPCDAPEGHKVVINLCGHGGSTPCVNPDYERVCTTESIRIGGTNAFYNTWLLRGPRRMIRYLALTVTSIGTMTGTTTGRRVKVNVSSPGSFNTDPSGYCDLRGRFLRAVKADGREGFFPIPIADCGTGWIELHSDFTSADIAAVLEMDSVWEVAEPAVWVRNPDGGEIGVTVRGQGADHIGDNSPAIWDATLERIGFYRLWIGADGITMENLHIVDGFQQRGDGSRYRNVSMANGFILGDSLSQGRGSSYSIGQEPMGRCMNGASSAACSVSIGSRNPEAAYNGSDIVSYGPFFIGDYSHGNDDGKLRVHHSLSSQAWWTVDGGINVIGPSSELFMTDYSYLFFEQKSSSSYPEETTEGSGIWVSEGASARIRACVSIGTVGTTNHVDFIHPSMLGDRFARVGWGASISAEAFCGAYADEGWEGFFSRFLEMVVTPEDNVRPLFDDSRIRDKVHEMEYQPDDETEFYHSNNAGGQG